MIWVDKITAVLKDSSIVNFYDNGTVELYPSKKWRKPKKVHLFYFNSKDQAINVFQLIEEF